MNFPENITKDEKEAFEKMRSSDSMLPGKKEKENFFNRFKKIFD